MSYHDALRKARDFVSAQGGEIAPLPISEEELNPEAQDDLSVHAYPLEAMTTCYRVEYDFPQDSTISDLAYFEDGKQRTLQIGFIPTSYGNNNVLIPVHFFVVAAVILQRNNGLLSVWDEPEIRKGILIQKSLAPNQQILSEFEKAGLMVVDSEAQGGDYYELRKRALQQAKKQRLNVEDRLIERWRLSANSGEGFLVVDGTLMNLRNEDNVERCIGVSKSFGSRYFSVSDHNRILQMNEFERSWTFRFHSPDEGDDLRMGGRERLSWYLRLRKRLNADPEFGLIRVEISRRHLDRLAEQVQRLSRSLISERLPTSYPSPRWDKHLYPIRECENYLASIMPSISTINASMKGVQGWQQG